MNDKSYTITILLNQEPEQVFYAINNVRGWWPGEFTGDTDKLGGEFTYQYKDIHHSVQKITEFVPGKKIVWHVTDSNLSFVKNKTEWTGTDIIFEIEKKGDKTELRFTHEGLVPSFLCYGDCSRTWGTLINNNLRNLIVTGKDQSSAF